MHDKPIPINVAYIRSTDGAEMIEIAPGCYANIAALARRPNIAKPATQEAA